MVGLFRKLFVIHFRSKGFTLVELLVVIAVIGTLATLLLVQLGAARQRARDVKRVADINQVRTALELFFDDNGAYPGTMDMTALVTAGYLTRIPTDPLTTGCTNIYGGNGCYGYAYDSTAPITGFHIWAELERNNRQALSADLDLNSTLAGWVGSQRDGATETCPDSVLTSINCVYDVGVNP